jgi:uncharacterized protein YqeY
MLSVEDDMALLETVTQHITDAMKNRDQAALGPLRMLKAALMNREVEKSRALDDAESLQVVSQLVKQRKDSIDQFRAGGRADLADKEQAELTFLEKFLPPAADPAAIQAALDRAVTETGATSVKDTGKVMKAVTTALAGFTVDGRTLADAVKQRLSGGQ